MVSVTAGNALGGSAFVALLKYGHVVRGNESIDVSSGADLGSGRDDCRYALFGCSRCYTSISTLRFGRNTDTFPG